MPSPHSSSAEQRLRAAVESSPSGLLMTDARGAIVLVNREVERLFGYAREELLGQSVEVLVPERFRGGHGRLRGDFAAEPRVREMGAGRELRGLRKDGTEILVEIGLTPVATEEGMFVVASLVDTTARHRAEEERRRLEEDLRQAQKLEAVGTLANGIAHDFNNILFAIMGYAEMAGKAKSRKQAAADLDELVKAAARGREIIDRILVFSRKSVEERRPLRLGPAVAEAVKLLRMTLPPATQVRERVAGDTPAVLGDTTSIYQILVNLASNAAHAMPQGGVIEIAVEPRYLTDSSVRAHPGLHEGLHAALSVRDEGTGMDAATLARAFEPFFTTKPMGRGTGLGLSIVQAIVRRHDGAVELRSEPGRGTTVTCFFPALQAAPADEEPEAVAAAPRGLGERVLLVEDEPTLAELNARRLSALGYRVTVVCDPVRALEDFRRRPAEFDLVVSDHLMPRLLGLDLAREIHDRRPEVPIVLLSGLADDLLDEAVRAAGVRRVLRKPVTLGELGAALRSALEGTRPAG